MVKGFQKAQSVQCDHHPMWWGWVVSGEELGIIPRFLIQVHCWGWWYHGPVLSEQWASVGGRTGMGSKHLREVTALWSVHNLHDVMHTTMQSCRLLNSPRSRAISNQPC